MATRRHGDETRARPVTRSVSIQEATQQSNTLTNGFAPEHGIEEEYHTEESEDSDVGNLQQQELEVDAFEMKGEPQSDAPSETAATGPPLLPIELLQPLPSPAYSSHRVDAIPRSQMSRRDKRAERNRNRRAKKLQWERIREEANANGVVAAGRVAQIKRAVVGVGRRERFKSGRVERDKPAIVSGRQRLVELRKKEMERSQAEGKLGAKKVKKKPRR